jgi:methionine-gamma-lyase
MLEGLDLLKENPTTNVEDVVEGIVFSSGMAAISAAVLARVETGQTIIAQQSLYSNSFGFLHDIAPQLGINVVWVKDISPEGWMSAFEAHPETVLIFAETPANPTMLVVDLRMLAELALQYECWLLVDNTFATPYCQRPLSLGADVVVHSTTKYLSGHGVIVGGAVISTHLDYIHQDLVKRLRLLGGAPSPFDAWLANIGLKTFELRMQRHCENALTIARYLQGHPKIAHVHYPGLESDPGFATARSQMSCFGGMLSFELKGGLKAGTALMDSLRVATLAVSLGNVDTLIQHPASMTHAGVPPQERLKMGISDGLVRFSVGIENVQDLIADLQYGLSVI